jgi:membrane-associated phospholipid phosphatase
MIKSKKFWVAIAILLLGNGACYWLLKLFQSNFHYFNFAIDDKIPFLTRVIWIYNSFYPIIFLSYYLMFKKGNEDTFMKCIISCVVGCLICYVIFLCYPTKIDHGVIPDTDFLTKLHLDITYFFDNPAINCFPSIHCLFCFEAMYGVFKSKGFSKKLKTFFLVYLFLIAISTVFVKQHYFIDIIGGLVVCIIGNVITYVFHLYDKVKKIKIFA